MLDYGTADGMQCLDHSGVVQFVIFDDDQPITCRVSRKCLEDNCGHPLTAAALLGATKQNFHHITHRIGRLIRLDRYEPDGSILLWSSDW